MFTVVITKRGYTLHIEPRLGEMRALDRSEAGGNAKLRQRDRRAANRSAIGEAQRPVTPKPAGGHLILKDLADGERRGCRDQRTGDGDEDDDSPTRKWGHYHA